MMEKLHNASGILYEDGPVSLLSATQNHLHDRTASLLADRMANRVFSNAVGTAELRTKIATETFPYAEGEDFEINRNSSRRELPNGIQSYCGTYSADQLIASVIDGAIVSNYSMALTKNKRLIMDSIGPDKNVLQHSIKKELKDKNIKDMLFSKSKFHPDSIPEATSQIESGVFMIRSGSYFHWVLEFLSNIRAVRIYESITGVTPTILIERDPPSWIIEYLKIAGYDENVMTLPSQTVLVEHLILPSRRRRSGFYYNPCPRDLIWLREFFSERVSNASCDYADANRIYISRNDADSRRVINETKIIKELNNRGFESIELSKLSVAEQIKLFQEANYVVGPHGAGLTNTIFADSTALFELFPEGGVRHVFYCLACQLDFDYDFLVARSTNDGDLIVDIETFIERIDGFIYS